MCLQLSYVETTPKGHLQDQAKLKVFSSPCLHRQSCDSHRRTVRQGPETVSSIILSSLSAHKRILSKSFPFHEYFSSMA